MPAYLSPGVYVEEVPSAVKPIAGVSTSTAAFIGIVPDVLDIPANRVTNKAIGVGDGNATTFNLTQEPTKVKSASVHVYVNGKAGTATFADATDTKPAQVTFATAPTGRITADYTIDFTPIAAGEVKLCTNFTEFKRYFGDFSIPVMASPPSSPPEEGSNRFLAHAVYGFFNNGGSRCYVARVLDTAGVGDVLKQFEAIDEIAIVAAPGITDAGVRDAIVTHCRIATGDRFGIFDGPQMFGDVNTGVLADKPPNSDYAAYYFPWLQVFDQAAKLDDPRSDGLQFVPPSGHMAGIYARVDNERGVHKAPANEVVMGALGLRYNLSKSQQDGLNPQGVNCIRNLNGNIRVWGARTIGGDDNADLKYINVRRTLLFLRKSIEDGTQWVVFEPNNSALWQKITRNVTAFLTNVWRDGALFGDTPQQAFYVKCDEETNPPSQRDLGQVVTEIGVSIVRPAEFVIFRISQWAGPGGQ